jgi:hypothetical protein
MRRIAIILILFQLIGCAKQPTIVNKQPTKEETNPTREETKTREKTPTPTPKSWWKFWGANSQTPTPTPTPTLTSKDTNFLEDVLMQAKLIGIALVLFIIGKIKSKCCPKD